MGKLPDPLRAIARLLGRAAVALPLVLALLAGCGEPKQAPSIPQQTEAEKLASGYTKMNGYLVPPPQVDDPTLPDSCALLTSADPEPKELITEPLAEIERMTSVCIARPESPPGYDHSIAVEVRHPDPLEIEAGIPKDIETFWVAEGGGIDLLGGRREQVQEIAGLGDFATWYPITNGLGLHTYRKSPTQGQYIIRMTIRGIDMDTSLAWAKTVAQSSLDAIAKLENNQVTPAQ